MRFSLEAAKLVILAVAVLGCAAASFAEASSSFHFNFTSFPEQTRNELLHNNSTVAKDAIQVTYDVRGSIASQSGRVFYKERFQLWKDDRKVKASFNTTFVLNILNQTAGAGEGLALVLAGSSVLPPDSEGQWLGVVNAKTNGSGQAQIVAIEFDTKKSYDQDLGDSHVGLDVNSVYSVSQKNLNVSLSNGNDVTVQVRYDGERIAVFVGNIGSPVLSEAIDLSVYLPDNVFIGFSASTGANDTQLNCVKSWSFEGLDIGGDSKASWVWIVLLVVALVLLSGLAFYWWRRYRAKKLDDDDIEGQITGTNLAPRKFRLKELRKATGNFNPKSKLGKGGFGTVYKGIWRDTDIAVKRVSETSRQGKQEFISEVTTIGGLRHKKKKKKKKK